MLPGRKCCFFSDVFLFVGKDFSAATPSYIFAVVFFRQFDGCSCQRFRCSHQSCMGKEFPQEILGRHRPTDKEADAGDKMCL